MRISFGLGFKISVFFIFSVSLKFFKCRFSVLSLVFMYLCMQVLRPGSVPPNTRDNLYQGLPPSVKAALRFRLQDTTNGSDLGHEVSLLIWVNFFCSDKQISILCLQVTFFTPYERRPRNSSSLLLRFLYKSHSDCNSSLYVALSCS